MTDQSNTLDSLINKLTDLTDRSARSICLSNTLSRDLEKLQHDVVTKDYKLDDLSTRYENSQIFLQHLTSLNLRSEFLNNQVNHLENKQKVVISATKNQGLKEFREWKERSIEWRTTETTFENLCLEYDYLSKQLKIANTQNSFGNIDDSIGYNFMEDRSNSVFSENNDISRDTTDSSNINISNMSNNNVSSINSDSFDQCDMLQEITPIPKKKLLKMESFLNIPYQNNKQVFTIPSNNEDITPIRGFKLNKIEIEKKDNKNQRSNIETNRPSKRKVANSKKKKFDLIELPSIVEEDTSSRPILHKRHSSLPENASIGNTFEDKTNHFEDNKIQIESNENDSLRHFLSYDTGLSKFNTRFNIEDFSFVDNINYKDSNSRDVIEAEDGQLSGMISSSPLSTFKHSHIDNDDDGEECELALNDIEEEILEADGSVISGEFSEESYGEEDAQPFSLLDSKKSDLYLRRCNSHESIFSQFSIKKTKPTFKPEQNLDLKAQTMKWLTPNQPIVSSSTQPYAAAKITATGTTTKIHDDMISYLHSNAPKEIESESTNKCGPNLPLTPSKSWISQSIFSPQSKPIEISPPVPDTTMNDEMMGSFYSSSNSWFSNLIPNSALIMSEKGRLIGQPSSRAIIDNNNHNNIKYNISNRPQLSNSLKSQHSITQLQGPASLTNKRRGIDIVTKSNNGPHSSLMIDAHGNRIIKHGYGSGFNNSVLSSRVSHAALREALAFDMI